MKNERKTIAFIGSIKVFFFRFGDKIKAIVYKNKSRKSVNPEVYRILKRKKLTRAKLKDLIKINDWTAMTVDNSAYNGNPEQKAVAEAIRKYVLKMFGTGSKQKGFAVISRYYSDSNPLMLLLNKFADIVVHYVMELKYNRPELAEKILSRYNLEGPTLNEKSDIYVLNTIKAAIDQTDFVAVAKTLRENSDEQDFNTAVPDNHRYIDHLRRYEHTRADAKVISVEEMSNEDSEERYIYDDYDFEETTLEEKYERFLASLNDTDRTIIEMSRQGYTQNQIAEKLGYANNSPVSKHLDKLYGQCKAFITTV